MFFRLTWHFLSGVGVRSPHTSWFSFEFSPLRNISTHLLQGHKLILSSRAFVNFILIPVGRGEGAYCWARFQLRSSQAKEDGTDVARFKRPQIISSASADLCVTLGDSFNLYFFLYKRGNNFFCEGFFPFFLAQVCLLFKKRFCCKLCTGHYSWQIPI